MKQFETEDFRIVQQPHLDIRMRFEIYDRKENYIGTLNTSVVNGTGSIDAESDIRRSASVTVVPDARSKIIIDEQGYIWVDKFVHIYVGIIDMRTGEIREWKFGKFVFSNTSTTYDATNNQMTINCSDMMALLDGSKNGELGQLEISYPAYEEDEEGHPTKYNVIREAVIDTVSQLGRINDLQVDDIGEYNAMPLYNENYQQYRIETTVELPDGSIQQLWNTIPFDQTFSAGTSVLNIITTFRDLYPNYEAYFNENGTFCMNMIPSGDEDPVVIDDRFFQSVYVSENTSIDLSSVRNVCHVWGQVLETDYYADTSTLENNTYSVEIEGYEEKYMNGDKIAFKVLSEIEEGEMYVNINNFGKLPIYDENTETFLNPSFLLKDNIYVFKIKSKYVNHESEFRAYWLGAWQVQGICALVSNSRGEDLLYVNTVPREGEGIIYGFFNVEDGEFYLSRTYQDGKYVYSDKCGKTTNVLYYQEDIDVYYRCVRRYSSEYFENVYACPSVRLKVIPNSPFTCQAVGEYMDVFTDDKNITSNSLAVSRADWEIYKQGRLTDSISLTTILCPFADVNIKVNYRRHDLKTKNPYIVKNISHDFSAGTTTWQLMRFYPLYERMHYTHGELHDGRFTLNELSAYTHERI